MNPQEEAQEAPSPNLPALPTPGVTAVPARKKLSRRASIVGGVLAVLLLVALGALAWYVTRPATPGAGAAVGPGGPGGFGGRGGASTVGVATAEKASIPVIIDALGTVTPQATVRVRPQVSGVLQQVLFKEGQMVKAGDLMALIDPRQFEMALMQAVGQRQRDEAQLDSAKVTLARYKTLLEQDSIARQDVDTQAALVKQLEGTVVVDRASEGTARLNLSYTRVVAPVSGRVGLRAVDVGNVVSNSDANGVGLITQITPIDVAFSIPQDRVGDLLQQGGTAAPIKVTALDRTRVTVLDTGVFASLDNQVDTTTGTVKAKARFNNTQLTLFPSQFVNVQLTVRTIDNAVVVPVAAVRQGSGGDYLYVLNADRTVSLRSVTRGQATVDKIVIATGLQAGERVITEGADRLKDGSRVTLAGDANAGLRQGGGRRQGASAAAGAASGNAAPMGAASGAEGTRPQRQTGTMGSMGGDGQGRRPGADAQSPSSGAQAPAGNVAAAPVAPATPASPPTAEQRQRFLDQVKGDAEQLARRKEFLAKVDAGDPEALERWQRMSERRRPGGGQQPAP